MNGSQERLGLLSRMGIRFLKILSFIGFLVAIAGLFMCFTGVGAIAGVPSMAIGLLVGRLGLSIGRDSSYAASKRSGCLVKFLGVVSVLIIVQLIISFFVFIWMVRNYSG